MKKSKIFHFIFFVILIVFVVFIYNKYYFNDYSKAVKEPKKTSFYRDNKEKFSKQNSYCIESKEYNTALFSKEINVKKNTPYKVTCFVKTENISDSESQKIGGANICIIDTIEKSESIKNANEWTKLEFMFNSKNREKVQIGFRLGSYDTDTKGKVWFSDIKVEEGTVDQDTNWKIGCFAFKNMAVMLNDGTEYRTSMNDEDMKLINEDVERLKNSIPLVSLGNMTMEIELNYLDKPLDSISYEEENGYYINYTDVYDDIIEFVKNNNYDHIFIIFKAEDINKGILKVAQNDWVGLGGMDFLGVGFSNIRIPENEGRHMYEYKRTNRFPEEVFIHEFLHTLERNSKEFELTLPALHDYEKYGYKVDNYSGLRNWYIDYMSKSIISENDFVGVDKILYRVSKPINSENFINSKKVEFDKEPENLVELVELFVYNSKKLINAIKEGEVIKIN